MRSRKRRIHRSPDPMNPQQEPSKQGTLQTSSSIRVPIDYENENSYRSVLPLEVATEDGRNDKLQLRCRLCELHI